MARDVLQVAEAHFREIVGKSHSGHIMRTVLRDQKNGLEAQLSAVKQHPFDAFDGCRLGGELLIEQLLYLGELAPVDVGFKVEDSAEADHFDEKSKGAITTNLSCTSAV